MEIVDIHTHHEREGAIFSCMPSSFHPTEGRYYSVGIHPWYITDKYAEEWEVLQQIASDEQILAIGETGLDKLTGPNMALQLEVFEQHVELSEQIKKPLIIHSVRTSNELISLKKRYTPSVPWIIHGFRGNENIASQLIEHDIYLSFGEKYQQKALLNIPMNRVLLETDDSPEDIMQLYSRAASILSLPDNLFMEQVRQNIEKVFFNG